MKKIGSSLLLLALGCTMAFTGCSKEEQITNTQKDIVFNGASVVQVGDNLFYANGFSGGVNEFDTSNKSAYDEAKETSYLAMTKDQNGTKYQSPENVEKVADELAGFASSYMFCYENYVYYATPNLTKTNENKYVWNNIEISRVDINGGKVENLFNHNHTIKSDSLIIKALNFNSKAYLVIFDGSTLLQIELGKKPSIKTISTNATSASIPDEGQEFDGYIYFTEDRNLQNGQGGNVVLKYSLESGETTKIAEQNSLTTTFTGRVENTLFFTQTNQTTSVSETRIVDANEQGDFYSNSKFFYPTSIANVKMIAENNSSRKGYVFDSSITDGKNVIYYSINKNDYSVLVDGSDGYVDCVLIDGGYFYYTTSEGIYRCSVLADGKEDDEYITQTIMTGMTMQTGSYGYGRDSHGSLEEIYFYAQREYEPVEEDENQEDDQAENDEEEEEIDENYYLHTVRISNNQDIKLVGKTKNWVILNQKKFKFSIWI